MEAAAAAASAAAAAITSVIKSATSAAPAAKAATKNPNPNPNQEDSFIAWINFLYKNKIFDEVLTDILLSVLLIFVYLCAYAYLKVRANSSYIRKNWPTYRCNPSYMPFAGMVMQPTDMSNSEYAQMNFEHCFQSVMNGVATSFMEPLYYTQSLAGNILSRIANALNSVRELINYIRNAISSVIADIMGRTLNVMQPIMLILIKVRDVIGKMQGLVTTQLYTVYGVYQMMLSGLRTVFEIMVIILIAMGATLIAVWVGVAVAIAFGPFGIPAMIALVATGTVLTAIFIGIAVPLGIISDFLAKTMKISGLAVLPSPPRRRR
jgi:hypothetical protein